MEDIAEVKACEEALRTAMLAGDVDALSALIDDRLVFTGPDGRVLSKADDLAAHRSSLIKIHRMDVSTAGIHRIDPMILTTTMVALSGTFAGQPIAGSFAYTRLWTRSGRTWRIVAGQAAAIG